MRKSISFPQSVLILADESADWKVAGLRQLDRVTLALNDLFRRSAVTEPVPVCIQGARIALSRAGDLTHISFAANLDDLPNGDVFVTSTRVVFVRDTLPPPLAVERSRVRRDNLDSLRQRVSDAENGGCYLYDQTDVAGCAKQLFANSGKSQDGIVSRFINRPLSRNLSQLMACLPLAPNQWTLLLMTLPLAGAMFLLRGDYLGFAIGAVLFQLHSALDGCDGEIARVKYLESEAGGKLDGLCDRVSTLLFAIGLGFGLSRLGGNTDLMRWLYALEGIGAAIFIGVTETLLTRHEIDDPVEADGEAYRKFVTGNRQSFNQGDQLKLWMIKHSGILSAGDGATSFFGQLTKRDVFNFVFMLLALVGFAQWVLHILAVCACAIIAFGIKDLLRTAPDVNSAA